jgi:dTDP-4-dehydrorhamnose 3,5-epimerase
VALEAAGAAGGVMHLEGTKDTQSVTASWDFTQALIDGVTLFEVKNVLADHRRLTEVFRAEWEPSRLPVLQVYQVCLSPGFVSDWNCHKSNLDRLFIGTGHIKLVLFDGRQNSRSIGRINELHLGEARPGLVAIPPGVWHGFQCFGPASGLIVSLPSQPFDYESPDHYRLPSDTPEIPYRWRS